MDDLQSHQHVETLETLAGERGKAASARAAVRIEDLRGILEIKKRLQSQKAAGSSPTKAEFDALVEDVHDMHNRLVAVMEALQRHLI